jgi:hypothetical protein
VFGLRQTISAQVANRAEGYRIFFGLGNFSIQKQFLILRPLY